MVVKQGEAYKQCEAYTRHNLVYVKVGSGFYKIGEDKRTTSEKIRVDEYDLGELTMNLGKDKLGWLEVQDGT